MISPFSMFKDGPAIAAASSITPSDMPSLRAHAAEYGIDPEHVAVWGEPADKFGDLAFLGAPDSARPWSTNAVMNLITGFLGKNLAHRPEPRTARSLACG